MLRKRNFREAAYFALFALRGQAVGKYYHGMLQEDRDGIPPGTGSRHLTRLLAHCRRHVPYYAELMRQGGDSFADDPEGYLARLPLLTKEIIRKRFGDLMSDDLQRRHWYFNTSGGSTGEPIRFVQDWESAARSGAITLLFSKLAGREIGEPELYLWGSSRDVAKGTQSWRAQMLLKLSNTTILNGFVMTPAAMRRYVAVFNAQRPKLIVAYADSMYELARFAEREGLRVEPQAAIITSAGVLYPFMREKIESLFQTRVYDRYGSREVGDIACERPGFRGMWVAPWGNYIEIVDGEGRRVPDGSEGDIIVTSLSNFAMPLVRYRIGDRGVLSPPRRTGEMRQAQMLEGVLGRSGDMIRGKGGELIHGGYFMVMLFFREWIRKYQVVQTDTSRVIFRIVREGSRHPQAELDEIAARTRLVLGDDCEVSFEFVDEIPATGSGKFRYIISDVESLSK